MASVQTQPRRSVFRPCIDLHEGVVKQIVGGSLRDRIQKQAADASAEGKNDGDDDGLKTNFVSR